MRYLLVVALALAASSCKRSDSESPREGHAVPTPIPSQTRPFAAKPTPSLGTKPSAASWPDSIRSAMADAARSAASQPARVAPIPRTEERPVQPPAVYQGKPASHWLAVLTDKDYRTRRAAALALAELSPSGVDADGSQTLAQYLNDPDELTRVRITLAYYQATKDPKSASVLADIMERDGDDEHYVACIEAARAAGRMGRDGDAAVPVMLKIARKFAYPQLGREGFPQLQDFGYACVKAIKEIDPTIETDNFK